MDNQGSFGAVSPEGMSAIRNAMERRGMGDSVPLLNQQSQVSPTPAPVPPQPQGGVAPNPQTEAGQMTMTDTQSIQPTGTPIGSPEAELIIKALDSRLKSLSNIEQAQVGLK